MIVALTEMEQELIIRYRKLKDADKTFIQDKIRKRLESYPKEPIQYLRRFSVLENVENINQQILEQKKRDAEKNIKPY